MTTLWVTVSEVILGEEIDVGSTVPVVVMRSPSVQIAEVLAAVFQADGLFILDDTTGWVPLEGAIVERPSDVPSVPMLQPCSDEVWLLNGAELIGLFSETDDRSRSWGLSIDSLDGLTDALRNVSPKS